VFRRPRPPYTASSAAGQRLSTFSQHLELATPLFALVLVGALLVRFLRWPPIVGQALTRFLFGAALPALLFRLMADLSRLPPVDLRVLVAYFGGSLIVFAIGRLVGLALFRLDGVSQSVFALGGIFSNNVFLGIPMAQAALGDAAMPAVALVLIFNSLTLWTLAAVSVEWARYGELSLKGFGNTARNVLTNPVVASILAGAGFGMTGWALPPLVDAPLKLLGDAAIPLSLVLLGMGLAEHGIKSGLAEAGAITVLKLVAQPLVVWAVAVALGLPPLETQVVVLLAVLPVGINVYLMAREFDAMQSPVATSMVLSTVLAVATTPLALTLLGA
jgi:malonate transporter and related proteins